MTEQRIVVTVDRNGQVGARRWEDDAHSPSASTQWAGLDAELVRLFERWLALRDRAWRSDEIRAFGDLLHRCLFPERVWPWVEEALGRGGPIRLSLAFPATEPYSRMAAIPWEYLHVPARAGRAGTFLASTNDVVLSRYIPSEAGVGTLGVESRVRLLAVVSQPDELGRVRADPVLAVLEGLDGRRYGVSVLHDPTAAQLADVLADREPHLVHFIGHGKFDVERGEASIALSRTTGETDWVDDNRLAEIVRRACPRVMVLHACEGARADFSTNFAGLAPQLVRAGVQCVVAMQYAVTNRTAIDFSTAFYSQLAAGRALDEAVQEARWRISGRDDPDPRLLGVPVVYLHSRDAVLAS